MSYSVYCDGYLLYDTKLDDYVIVEPRLSLELNKAGMFTFTIFPQHPNFARLKKLKSIITVYQGNNIIFRGRILNDEQGWYNERQVTCEGELAFLIDSIQRPYNFQSGSSGTTPADLFTYFINNHNAQVDSDHQFIVGNVTVTDPNDYIVRSNSDYSTTWDAINDKLVSSLGGYLWVRYETDGVYIDYLSDFNTLGSQTVEFGQNLLDLSRTIKGEDIATAIIPLGAKSEETGERLTIKSVNDNVDYIFDQTAVNEYGWIFKTVIWDNVTVASNLLAKARTYLSRAINLTISLELSAVDLSSIKADINAFRLGSYIRVKTSPHNLNTLMLVSQQTIALDNPKNNKMILGTTFSSFTDQVVAENKNLSEKVVSVLTEGDLNAAVTELRQETASALIQTSTQIMSQVSDEYYTKDAANTLVQSINTQFTQTSDSFEMRFNEFSQDLEDVQEGTDAKFQNISKYIRFIDGNIILGEENNPITLVVENDKISFIQDGNVNTKLDTDGLEITSKSGETIASFKNDGVNTPRLRSDKLIVGGLLINLSADETEGRAFWVGGAL